jgi:DNA-binding response OmpR family regulator
MQDKDTANTLSVSGNKSLLQGTHTHDEHRYEYPWQNQLEVHNIQQRILVVEDDPTLATLEAEILTAHGYIVAVVHDGELAIAIIHNFIPDLVVLDFELPGALNGWDVLQLLRSYSTIPVLFTTSSITAVRKYIRSRGETRFTLDHLPKPYPMQTLLKRVKRMLMVTSQ